MCRCYAEAVSHALLESLKLTPPRYFPPDFIAGFAEMTSLFRTICRERGWPPGCATRVAALVPETIRSLPCILDELTGVWRYEFGAPITLGAGRLIVGTTMLPEVERLLEVLCCAAWRLSSEQLRC